MPIIFAFIIFSATSAWGQRIDCPVTITTVSELDECLSSHNQGPTQSVEEILAWKKKLNLSKKLRIEVSKIQDMAWASCGGHEERKLLAAKLSQEVEKILEVGSLQIKNWRIPGFPPTGAKDYSMKSSRGCDVKDLLFQMKRDVDSLVPDLMNVYNLGLAIDTTKSQKRNMQVLVNSIDAVYESIPADAKVSFVVTSYGDAFREGLKFEGNKGYVLSKVKNFILRSRIYGGDHPDEFVYGGSYITSKTLDRAHGLIFNWTNGPGDNTKAQGRKGSFAYSLSDLSRFAKTNVHIIRNVFLRCR